MTEPTTTPEPLPAEAASRLAEFARACKAAAQAVSLYGAIHPAMRSSLARLVDASNRATAGGALDVQVLPDGLLVGGRAATRPDPAIGELAALFHRHSVGRLVLQVGADAESWRTLLLLLSRAPEETRAEGGIAHLWATAGGPSIELHEIDYAEMLRERGADGATLDAILSACLKDATKLDLDDTLMQALLNMIGDPTKIEELAARLQERAAGEGVAAQAAAVLRLLRGVVSFLARTQPDQIDRTLRQMGGVVGRLSAEVLTQLLKQRESPDAMAGSINVVGSLIERVEDSHVAHFVAGSVIAERGPSDRLAEAFQALVPDNERKRQLLSLAEQEVAESAVGQEESFPEMWQRVERMLTEYSDKPYVSDAYGRELSGARSRAVDVEKTSDDPPERIATWVGSVGDSVLRALDLQLLLDLLTLEQEAVRWRDLAETVASHVDDLARVGQFEAACQLVEALAREAEDGDLPGRRPSARAMVTRLASGPAVRRALAHMRAGDDASFEQVKRLCHALGPVVIGTLAEVLSAEQDARARRRLRDILLAFGARGRESIQQLMSAANWEVRRTAAYLLREFGGTDTLPALEPLLNDSEPLVQREAIRAVVLLGDDRAYELLARSMRRGGSRLRETFLQELQSSKEERIAPLCCYLIRNLDHRTMTDVYLASIDALGTYGGPDAVEALREALYRGEWWAPVRTRTLRAAAAGALGKAGTPDALQVLRDASARAPRGVRAAARSQLALVTER